MIPAHLTASGETRAHQHGDGLLRIVLNLGNNNGDGVSTSSWIDGRYLTEQYPNQQYTVSIAGQNQILPGRLRQQYDYTIGAQNWVVKAMPQNPRATPQCMSQEFYAILTSEFPGWTFSCSVNSLSDNSLVVKTYSAYKVIGVGIQLHVAYENHEGDPTTGINWIQVVWGNHDPAGVHGVEFSKVDIPQGSQIPYYYGAFEDETNFFDQPNMIDPNESHSFSFETYLVQETAPQTVVFWGGFEWGFCNAPATGSIPTGC